MIQVLESTRRYRSPKRSETVMQLYPPGSMIGGKPSDQQASVCWYYLLVCHRPIGVTLDDFILLGKRNKNDSYNSSNREDRNFSICHFLRHTDIKCMAHQIGAVLDVLGFIEDEGSCFRYVTVRSPVKTDIAKIHKSGSVEETEMKKTVMRSLDIRWGSVGVRQSLFAYEIVILKRSSRVERARYGRRAPMANSLLKVARPCRPRSRHVKVQRNYRKKMRRLESLR
ncbi:hypothetical protein CSKR_107975, partial [Clonorchis sinensis]